MRKKVKKCFNENMHTEHVEFKRNTLLIDTKPTSDQRKLVPYVTGLPKRKGVRKCRRGMLSLISENIAV